MRFRSLRKRSWTATVLAAALSACGGGSSDGGGTVSADTRSPTLVSTNPAQNATQVAGTTTVSTTWSEALATTATCAITPAIGGVDCRATVGSDGRTVSASNNGASLTFPAGATYSIRFTVRDAAGNGASATVTFSTAPTATAACPHSVLGDVWLNNRLGCLSVGQRFIDLSSGATGTKADTAYVVAELVVDSSFSNVLGPSVRRFFRHFLCVRNTPSNLQRTFLATDLSIAIGTSNQSALKPPGVGAVSLAIAAANEPSFVAMPCDPARHPVIVDYDTGRIESVNPATLAALTIYDM